MFDSPVCEPELCARAAPAPPLPRPVVAPTAPERYRIQFTVDESTHGKLEHARALLRHRIPNGDVALIFDRALTLLIAEAERSKCGATDSPHRARAGCLDTRHIPAAVRRAVWKRDSGQCAFIGTHGRCTERAFLEFHHIRPFGDGGLSVVENVSLRCRAHNQHEAEVYFGPGPLFVRERRERYVVSRTRSGPSWLPNPPPSAEAGRCDVPEQHDREGAEDADQQPPLGYGHEDLHRDSF